MFTFYELYLCVALCVGLSAKPIIVFKVPELRKRPVPEEKVPVPTPKKEEVAPPKGIPLRFLLSIAYVKRESVC